MEESQSKGWLCFTLNKTVANFVFIKHEPNIDKFIEVCIVSTENIGRITKCFQTETAMHTEANQRRMEIPAEVRKINGLRRDDILLCSWTLMFVFL